jgi:nucleolar protein 56
LSKFLADNLEGQDEARGQQVAQANLGLGHALARKNIKFDEKRQDKGIINSYSLLEQMEKNLNTFAMRVKEWYAWHFPELNRIVTDNETYVKFVMTVGHRDNVESISDEDLEALVGDADLAFQIRERIKTSMGNDLLEVDEENLKAFAEYTSQHYDFKKLLQGYLRQVMEGVAPNLTELLGETVGAKILTQAGGLTNLSKLPASTIQILGAEKALFRALKTKSATPKYGHLYNSTFIGKAKIGDKGKVSRCLANKCALASRLDHFLIKPSNKFGEIFKQQVQDRVDGVKPTPELSKRNTDQMQELVDELKSNGLYYERKRVKST